MSRAHDAIPGGKWVGGGGVMVVHQGSISVHRVKNPTHLDHGMRSVCLVGRGRGGGDYVVGGDGKCGRGGWD